MRKMSREECRTFLSVGSRTAKVASVRRDGRPHVAPVWFIVDGDDLVFMTLETSLKGRILKRDPRIMISVDDEAFPFGFVLVQGTASYQRMSSNALRPWAERIARRYVPAERLAATRERNAVEGELLVRVPLSNMTGACEVAA